MKRTLVHLVAVLGAFAATVAAPEARSETLPALAGKAWDPDEAVCFTSGFFSSGIRNTACAGSLTWVIPMTLSQTITYHFRASATTGVQASPSCRFVLRSVGDGNVALGTATFVDGANQYLGQANVTNNTTAGHIDCLMPPAPNKTLTQIRWSSS